MLYIGLHFKANCVDDTIHLLMYISLLTSQDYTRTWPIVFHWPKMFQRTCLQYNRDHLGRSQHDTLFSSINTSHFHHHFTISNLIRIAIISFGNAFCGSKKYVVGNIPHKPGKAVQQSGDSAN